MVNPSRNATAPCLAEYPPGHGAVTNLGAGPPPYLTWGTDEIVDWAWVSAELTDAVPVIEAWIAVHSACDTFG